MAGQNGWILARFFIYMFYARRCSPVSLSLRNTELHIPGSLVTAMKTVTYVFSIVFLNCVLRLLLTEQIKAVRAYCSVVCYELFFLEGRRKHCLSVTTHFWEPEFPLTLLILFFVSTSLWKQWKCFNVFLCMSNELIFHWSVICSCG